MSIDLSDYEKGAKVDGDYEEQLKTLQDRLAVIQSAYICHGRRAMIVFEGWDAAGKGGVISRLTATLDPRYFEVWPIAAPSPEELDRHFLWRFWNKLPRKGEIAIFDRSWYGRVLVERVEGYASDADWKRGYDEINEFEAQQHDSGTTILKLFLHITQKEQDKRLVDRLDHPWKRWKTGKDDFRNRAKRGAYMDAMHDMFKRTDTHWASWHVIDANSKKSARIAVLEYIADQLEATVSMIPPQLDLEILALAVDQIGYVPKDVTS